METMNSFSALNINVIKTKVCQKLHHELLHQVISTCCWYNYFLVVMSPWLSCVADLFRHLEMSVIFFAWIWSDNWQYIVCGVLVKMIVIYTEAVQLCCSLNDTLSQMVHLAITTGLDYSHLNRYICIKLQALVVLFKGMTNWASLFAQPRQQVRVDCIFLCAEEGDTAVL